MVHVVARAKTNLLQESRGDYFYYLALYLQKWCQKFVARYTELSQFAKGLSFAFFKSRSKVKPKIEMQP